MDRSVEIADRSDYQRWMNEYLRINPCPTLVLTVDEFESKVQRACLLATAAAK
jgi:hypothetical protein